MKKTEEVRSLIALIAEKDAMITDLSSGEDKYMTLKGYMEERER